METKEHKQAGDQIRIETFSNPYLKGSENLSSDQEHTLTVQMMHKVDGIPMPVKDLILTAGDIVALAGDYYTKAGWGLQLQIPQGTDNTEVINKPVSRKEFQAFRAAYHDLASPKVKKSDIQRIYNIEKSPLPNLLQQAVYALIVPGYSNKLNNNEAHFSPWSLRAYIVGHRSALRMAHLAYLCSELAAGRIEEKNLPEKLAKNLKTIRSNPKKYSLDGKSVNDVYTELGHRYHAMAVARDLFAMHFYSDHFAAGHLSRLGMMRKTLPDNFSFLGGILVNNMHNEDNEDSIKATNPFSPVISEPVISGQEKSQQDDPFTMLREDNQVYGDGTYFERKNDKNSNMLINGMDNSLGDIARLLYDGTMRKAENYGGLTFLPEINEDEPQPQPLFIAQGGDIYYRKDVWTIKQLSPADYTKTMTDPANQGYEQLTFARALLLVVKLRLGGLFFSPEIKKKEQPAASSAVKTTESSVKPIEPPAVPTKLGKPNWQQRATPSESNIFDVHGFFKSKPSPAVIHKRTSVLYLSST